MILPAMKQVGLIHDEQSYVRGLPPKTNERWKYAELSLFEKQPFVLQNCDIHVPQTIVDTYRVKDADAILFVFIDGRYEPAYSDEDKLPKEVIACSMDVARREYATIVEQYTVKNMNAGLYPFAAFNMSTAADGLFLHVAAGTHITAPLHVLSIATGHDGAMTHSQNMWVFGEKCDVTIFHEYVSLREETYFTNAVTLIAAEKASNVVVIKSQHEGKHAVHMENFFVNQQTDSHVSMTQVTTGAKISRDDIVVGLNGVGAVCKTSGFYHASRDGQYVDHHIDVKHSAPRTNSEMLYKGIADKKSRAVFNGSLYVEKDAQKINAVQGNHNLLLSNLAEVYSKPELEIYADDVKCRHGATTGQLDRDALFYLRARGIDYTTAVNILLKGFAEEVLQQIAHSALQQHVMQQVKFL